jgi:lipoprotein-anchoring transpeptidase ErfK/SrfK
MMLRRAAVLVAAFWCALAIACLVVVVAAVASISSSPERPAQPPPAAGVAAPPAAAAALPPPRRLGEAVATTRWASLTRDVEARMSPSREAGRVALLSRLAPEGTDNIVVPFRRVVDDDGRPWVEAWIPGLPSRQTGWIEGDALGPGGRSRARLVVDRERLTLSYVRAGRELLRARIGIGRRDAPTPAGRFYVRNRLTRYASPRYGPLAYGLSARSRLTDWPGGGFIGIHGTDRPDLVPGAVSHGCIRLANADIVRLGRLLRVGTPVLIV